jgi:hypothetical protein
MASNLGTHANSEEKLVNIEEYMDNCTTVEVPKLTEEYVDIKEWVKLLY